MAPKRLRRASGSGPVRDPLDEQEPEPIATPERVNVSSLAVAQTVSHAPRQRQRTRTFSSKVIVSNALCNEQGVQLPGKYFALSICAQLPDKESMHRFNNILKYGQDTAAELPKDTAGLLGQNDLLLHGGAFYGFFWQTAKTKLYGLNVERGAMQTLCISVEMAGLICDLVLPMLRTAGLA